MTYYAHINTEYNSIGVGQCPCSGDNIICLEISEEVYNNIDHYMYNGTELVLDPDYEQKQAIKERQRLDALTLTPADVERALFDAKEMDFDDLKALIVQHLPQVNLKRLSIEFRARDFYRGAMFGNIRLFDTVGALLGFTSEDMDYLFLNGSLPDKN